MSIFKKELLDRNGLNSLRHQMECVEWCKRVENSGVEIDGTVIRSGIIADEMGLGKTLQMLGLIVEQLPAKVKTLIVLPKCLLGQWERAIVDYLGHEPLVIHGPAHQEIGDSPIVLTTYGKMSGSRAKRRLSDVIWDRVIFDEAHHMRNPKSAVWAAADKLHATHKWMLSGTPIQNSLADIRSLCTIAGVPQELTKKESGLGKVISHIVLRRTKTSVGMQLPPLSKTVITVAWESEVEKELAEDIHAMISSCMVPQRHPGNEDTPPPHHFAALQHARQCCIDSSLLTKAIKGLRDANVVATNLDAAQQLLGRSKFNCLIKHIVASGRVRKKLVFCHYRREIDSVCSSLRAKGFEVASLDGRVSEKEREKVLLGEDIDVIVLQIKTGCEGLNLQRFTDVYFVTPHWNPSVEDQAIARCHRQGQSEKVRAYSMRMEPFDDVRATRTIDMRVNEVQLNKRIHMGLLERSTRCGDGVPLSDKCAICLDEQSECDSILLPCGHRFHTHCIGNWVKRAATCPTCRQ